MSKKKRAKQKGKPADTLARKDKRLRFLLPGILLLTTILFANSIGNGFTNLDDDLYIINNHFIKDLSASSIKAIFSSFYLSNYHPLTTLTYAIEYHFFGIDPKSYHVINLIIHLLNVLLVFRFVRLLIPGVEAAAIVALFFAIHPMHVESVAWISERKDLLYSFFYLSALISYLRYIANPSRLKQLFLVFLLFTFSLLSKSMAVTLPLAMLLIDYFRQRKFSRNLILEKVPFFILSFIFGMLAIKSQQSGDSIGDMSSAFSLLDKGFLISYMLMYYLLMLFVPVNLSVMHYYPETSALSIEYYFAPAVLILLVWAVFKLKDNKRHLIFGLLFFLATLLPVLQFIPVGNAIVAERYTYIPYIGLFFIIGQFYCTMKDSRFRFVQKAKPFILIVLISYILVFSVSTWNRNKVWKNGITLFSDVIKKYPDVFHGHFMRASAKSKAGDYRAALPDYDRAIQLEYSIARIYTGRGIAKRNLQDYIGAITDYDKAIELNPLSSEAYNNRGSARAMQNDYNGAIVDYGKVIELDTRSVTAYNNRGNARLLLQDYQGAIYDYSKTIELQPNHANAWYNRAVAKNNSSLFEDACTDWQMALQLGNYKAAEMIREYCN